LKRYGSTAKQEARGHGDSAPIPTVNWIHVFGGLREGDQFVASPIFHRPLTNLLVPEIWRIGLQKYESALVNLAFKILLSGINRTFQTAKLIQI